MSLTVKITSTFPTRTAQLARLRSKPNPSPSPLGVEKRKKMTKTNEKSVGKMANLLTLAFRREVPYNPTLAARFEFLRALTLGIEDDKLWAMLAVTPEP